MASQSICPCPTSCLCCDTLVSSNPVGIYRLHQRRIRSLFLLLGAFLSIVLVQAHGQNADPTVGFGLVPYQTYLGESENINLGTGNVHIKIPLLKLPGRNGHDFELYLSYNSQMWYVHNVTTPQGTISQYASAGGWQLGGMGAGLSSDQFVPLGSATTCTENYRVTLGDGRTIYFPYLFTNCYPVNGGNEQTQYENLISSSDPASGGSSSCSTDFAVLETFRNGSLPKLYLRNGETLWFDSNYSTSKDEDANGNVITYTHNGSVTTVTDTIGRTITFNPSLTSWAFTYNDSTGTPQTITINWGSYYTNPNFPITQNGEQNQPSLVGFVTSVVLPNGDKWQMSYDPDSTGHTYGELTKITYPTGGYTKYDYAFVGRASGDGSGANNLRQVIAKHVCKSYTGSCSTTDDTAITPTASSYIGGNSASTVIDPLGNKTAYTFSTGQLYFYETNRQIYSGTSTLLKTVATTPSCSGPTQQIVTLNNDNLVSKKIMPPDVPPHTWYGFQTTTTATSNSVVTTQEYGYGIGAPGGLLRQTVTTLMAINPVNNQNYTTSAVHVLGRKLSDVVQDGSGNPIAQTTYEYDNYSSTTPHANLSASGAVQHDSSYNASAGYTLRGNVTQTQHWLNGKPATWLPTTSDYDDAGNVVKAIDPMNNPTAVSFADSWGNASCTPSGGNGAAYLTSVTNALNQVTKHTYNSCTGSLDSTTDPNNKITTYRTSTGTAAYDALGRLTQTNYPDGGQTTVCYSDDPASGCSSSQPQLSTTTTTLITSSVSKTSVSLLDGEGNVVQTQLTSDPEGTDYVDTVYDGVGRKVSVSNPHRSGSATTDGVTTYSYDPLNRVKSVTEQDGSVVNTTYDQTIASNNGVVCSTVTDEAGNSRQSCVDGLGRMTSVWEDPAHLNYETDYTYDALNNLLSVTQKGNGTPRVRTFTYDSLSHLTSASNPESGTINYTYDNDGNLLTKVAALPNQTGSSQVTINYFYDSLNRLTKKTYMDGGAQDPYTSTVQYGYDGVALTGCTSTPPADTDSNPIGRRTSMCDGSGATAWAHDTMGRILSERRTIGAVRGDYETDAYNLAGLPITVTSLGYGVSYTYSGAARPLTATNYTGGTTKFASGATYVPPGELAGATLGSATGFAGFAVNNSYNDRLQPILLSASSPSATVFSDSFDFHLGAGDNGNVYKIVNNRDSTHGRDQNFMYDSLNRIQQAYSSGSGTFSWGETFSPTATSPGVAPSTPGIDAWGNLTNRSGVTGKTYGELLNCPANANNQLTACSNVYDAAGNMTGYGTASYVYDAENRLIATAGYSYVYDGDGQRVEKCSEGTDAHGHYLPGTCASGGTGTLYWRGIGSDPLSETDLAGTVQNTYVLFDGQRVARRDSAGAIHYYFSDHLGTHGVVENATGTVCEQDIDYYPYGGAENDYCSGASVPQNYKFTGKERDSESGIDMFGARYYGSFGRFMTPDWSDDPDPIPYADLGDPQSLNLYSYVGNNPISSTDDDGHICTQDPNSGNVKCVVYAPRMEEAHVMPYPTTVEFPSAWALLGLARTLTVPAIVLSYLVSPPNKYAPDTVEFSKTASPNPDDGGGKKPKPLQSGNSNKISSRTARALNKAFNKNLTPREWGRLLESLKGDEGVANNVHGSIMSNGDLVVNGNTVGNIGQYLP
jgi:RHS repeat-associated protein